MLGIPVIATKNDTVAEYVEENVTGFIIDKTKSALAAALEKLNDPEIHAAMRQNARRAYEERFSLYELGRRIGRLCEEGTATRS